MISLLMEAMGSSSVGAIIGGGFGWLNRREDRKRSRADQDHELNMLHAGSDAMIEIVRMEAKAQVDALSNAFDDDASLRVAAISFVAELRQKVDEAVTRENRMHLETHLRTGDGPAYLLIEAALA